MTETYMVAYNSLFIYPATITYNLHSRYNMIMYTRLIIWRNAQTLAIL